MNVEEWLDQPVPGFTRRRDSMSIPELRKAREVWQACLDANTSTRTGEIKITQEMVKLAGVKSSKRKYV